MRNTRPRARYGWLSLVTAVLSCVAGFAGVGWPAPPAHAAESAATVTFASVVTDDTGVTLTGTVTNTGTNPLYNAQVVFWHQIAPLTTTDQLNDALAADPTADTGDRLPESPAVIASGKNTFGPGQTAYFTVSASWADLKVSGDGAYLVGVHVRGAVTVRSALSTVGRGRTLVTMATTTTAAQATVVMLTSAPSRLHDNIFTDDHLAGELAGRLTTLLGLAHLGGVSWVIDPALYSEIATMASGYQVQGIGPSELVAGTGEAAAAAWLTSFATLDPASGYRLPWGNPDLGFGLATHNTSLLIDKTETLLADTATAPVAPTATPGSPATPAPPTPDPIDIAHLPLLIHPANNLVNSDFLTYIAPLEPDIVLAATPASTTLDHGSLLATQTTAYPDGPGPDDAHTTLQLTLRAAADAVVATQAVIRIITTEADAALASATLPAWLHPVTLRTLAATSRPAWTPDAVSGVPAGPLTTALGPALTGLRSAVGTYASLIGDPTNTAPEPLFRPLATVLSQSWPDDAAAAAYAGHLATWLTTILAGVTLAVSPDVALTYRTNNFPVTVSNTLTIPVYVRVFTSTAPVGGSPANVTVPPTAIVTIQPGDRLTVPLSPTVVREGTVDATIRLVAPDGTRIGAQAVVRLEARISAWMGWAVVGAAFILFAVGTVLRVRSRKRKGD